MGSAKRITANLPEDLLDQALQATGRGITETLVEGLKLIRHTRAYDKGMRLKSRLKLHINLNQLRERPHR